MIIYHRRNVAAFGGHHIYYWPTQPIITTVISATSVSAAIGGWVTGIAQNFTRPAEIA